METAILAVKSKEPSIASMERRASQNGRSAAKETTVTGKRLKYSIDEILGMGDSGGMERAEKRSLLERKIKHERESPLAGGQFSF